MISPTFLSFVGF